MFFRHGSNIVGFDENVKAHARKSLRESPSLCLQLFTLTMPHKNAHPRPVVSHQGIGAGLRDGNKAKGVRQVN